MLEGAAVPYEVQSDQLQSPRQQVCYRRRIPQFSSRGLLTLKLKGQVVGVAENTAQR